MSRTQWANRDPEWKDREGQPLYNRRAKVRIWSEKLKAEFFTSRKPTQTERLQIAAAVCLILDLAEAHEGFQALNPLPKNYIQKFKTLERILEGFRPKAPRKTGKAVNESGLGLAAILGEEV